MERTGRSDHHVHLSDRVEEFGLTTEFAVVGLIADTKYAGMPA